MQDFIHNKKLYYSAVEFAFSHIGGTWKIPILLCLEDGPVRYGGLRSRIPHITDKILHTQLRVLESKQMISRKIFREKPPKVEDIFKVSVIPIVFLSLVSFSIC
ncbi:helix-turn-helix domain-containing protein [Pedobacter heparinus]|uniref:winged helix-turn-helix transcriptional regulator n=1 Tax=Pedobacter heparinus TaxID=984 RepID=UPI0029316926|nr:helix-turn-helix domain-containing protein [Pedobacter heparinus]